MKIGAFWALLGALTFCATIVGTVGVIGWKVVLWLQTGSVPALPTITEMNDKWGLRYITTDWVGAQQIIDWIYSLSIYWPCLFIGLISSLMFFAFADEARSKVSSI